MNDLTTINPTKTEFEVMQRQVKMAVLSNMLPDELKKGDMNTMIAKAGVIALKGRELGIPMMQAFSQINVIKGKPTISAELMLALIYKAHPNAEITFSVLTNKCCEIKAKRPNASELTTITFTMEDADKAGLSTGFSWKKYPRALLRSRAVSEMARTLFPDAIMGCSYTPEEMGKDVDVEGEVIEVEKTTNVIEEKKPEVIEVKEDFTKGNPRDESHTGKGPDYLYVRGPFKGQLNSEVNIDDMLTYFHGDLTSHYLNSNRHFSDKLWSETYERMKDWIENYDAYQDIMKNNKSE